MSRVSGDHFINADQLIYSKRPDSHKEYWAIANSMSLAVDDATNLARKLYNHFARGWDPGLINNTATVQAGFFLDGRYVAVLHYFTKDRDGYRRRYSTTHFAMVPADVFEGVGANTASLARTIPVFDSTTAVAEVLPSLQVGRDLALEVPTSFSGLSRDATIRALLFHGMSAIIEGRAAAVSLSSLNASAYLSFLELLLATIPMRRLRDFAFLNARECQPGTAYNFFLGKRAVSDWGIENISEGVAAGPFAASGYVQELDDLLTHGHISEALTLKRRVCAWLDEHNRFPDALTLASIAFLQEPRESVAQVVALEDMVDYVARRPRLTDVTARRICHAIKAAVRRSLQTPASQPVALPDAVFEAIGVERDRLLTEILNEQQSDRRDDAALVRFRCATKYKMPSGRAYDLFSIEPLGFWSRYGLACLGAQSAASLESDELNAQLEAGWLDICAGLVSSTEWSPKSGHPNNALTLMATVLVAWISRASGAENDATKAIVDCVKFILELAQAKCPKATLLALVDSTIERAKALSADRALLFYAAALYFIGTDDLPEFAPRLETCTRQLGDEALSTSLVDLVSLDVEEVAVSTDTDNDEHETPQPKAGVAAVLDDLAKHFGAELVEYELLKWIRKRGATAQLFVMFARQLQVEGTRRNEDDTEGPRSGANA